MEEQIIALFQKYHYLAIPFSIVLNIVIAVLGVIPSYFITGANIVFFGFWQGTLLSIIGEILGAAFSFIIFRKNIRNISLKFIQNYPDLMKLINSEGPDAFYKILILRALPFVPSGLITLAAAIGKVSFFVFIIASSLGKLPGLLIEAFSVLQVIRFNIIGKFIVLLLIVFAIYTLLRKKWNKK